MARKKILTEGTENVAETAALDSLKPDSNRADGPNSFDISRSEKLAKIVATCGGISDEDINKFMEVLAQVGKEAATNPQGDVAGNRDSISGHPSAALGSATGGIKEDLQKLFGEQHTPEFIEKSTKIFESAVETRFIIEKTKLNEEFETKLTEAYDELSKELTEKVDQYLDYAVKQWLEENKLVAVQSFKQEITEEFIEGLKNLFTEHYIEVPEDKIDVVAELSDKVEELQESLNKQIATNIELTKSTEKSAQEQEFVKIAEGLSQTEVEKLRTLAEQVTADNVADYATKVKMLRENAFVAPKNKKTTTGIIVEETTIDPAALVESAPGYVDPAVQPYIDALNRTVKKH